MNLPNFRVNWQFRIWAWLWVKLFGNYWAREELRLLTNLRNHRHLAVDALCDFYRAYPMPFRITPGASHICVSPSMQIFVDDDCYGYEVKVGSHAPLLDCNPGYYGLTTQEGDKLYTAILSCVSTSTYYQRKLKLHNDNIPHDSTCMCDRCHGENCNCPRCH